MDQLMHELRKQIVDTLNLSDIDPDQINVDEPLIGDGLGLDSIDTLELIVLLEREYSVRVPDVETGRKVFSSVRSMAHYIENSKAKD
jgi:acyl carrier protein